MDKKEALMCAQVAAATYTNRCNLDEFRITAKFENKGTDTQGLFGEAYGDTFVIAFRGSEETGVADWITDIKFLKQVYPYDKSSNSKVQVHYGFITAYKSVRDAVLKAAKETKHKKIICAGHSLGGALATLAALDIQYNNPEKDIRCYTYGSPKVGNVDFVKSYNKRVPKTYRIVNQADVVPRLPPGGYDHVGQLLHVGQDGSVLSGFLEKLTSSFEDHFPHKYIATLKKFI